MRGHVHTAHRRDRLAAGRRSSARATGPFDLSDRPISRRRSSGGTNDYRLFIYWPDTDCLREWCLGLGVD